MLSEEDRKDAEQWVKENPYSASSPTRTFLAGIEHERKRVAEASAKNNELNMECYVNQKLGKGFKTHAELGKKNE